MVSGPMCRLRDIYNLLCLSFYSLFSFFLLLNFYKEDGLSKKIFQFGIVIVM